MAEVALLSRHVLGAGGQQVGQHRHHRHRGILQAVGAEGEQLHQVDRQAEGEAALQGIEVDPELLVLG